MRARIFLSRLLSAMSSWVYIRTIPCLSSLLSAAQDLEESFPEFTIESGVDDGVESAVYITQPCGGTVQLWGHMTGPAMGVQNMSQEKW